MMHISPFLMFDNQAEEAVQFYLSVFPNSEIVSTSHFSQDELNELERLPADQRPGPVGQVKMITMRINGILLNVGNGGSFFKFNHGVSMFVRCETQEEIDRIWNKLASDGGQIEECGWVRDKFGVPWQVTPAILDRWMQDPDPEKQARVGVQILRSKKLVIKELRQVYEGSADSFTMFYTM